MSVKIISRKMEARDVTFKMVDGSQVKGKINLFHDEIVISRMSDLFTKITDPFITVFDATLEGKTGRVCVLNKNNIVWVTPEEGS